MTSRNHGKLHYCAWRDSAPEFVRYHDEEWGFPVADDVLIFEKICLEGFQSGLSWRTILNKRQNFRAAFAGFDFEKVARYNSRSVERLLKDNAIVRNRRKIESVINNARRACELVDRHGSLGGFVWRYEPEPSSLGAPQSLTCCNESIALSRDLKKLGWSWVGPTTLFALMQALGLVNDHVDRCITREKVASARRRFSRPD